MFYHVTNTRLLLAKPLRIPFSLTFPAVSLTHLGSPGCVLWEEGLCVCVCVWRSELLPGWLRMEMEAPYLIRPQEGERSISLLSQPWDSSGSVQLKTDRKAGYRYNSRELFPGAQVPCDCSRTPGFPVEYHSAWKGILSCRL